MATNRLILKSACLALLIALIIPRSFAAAEIEGNKWLKVSIPAEGPGGNCVLAGGSDVQHITLGADGALYACGKGLTYTLYKSPDGGSGWAATGNVQHNIAAIAASPGDADFICYATTSSVYLSRDGGKNFDALPAAPGGAGSGNIEITSLAVAQADSHIVIAGTRDTDNGQFGGVYTLDAGQVVPAWVNTNIGSYDVCAMAASPNFTADRQIVAVVTDETDTFVITRRANTAWGADTGRARLNKDNTGGSIAAASAAIAFPEDYEADASSDTCIQFIGVSTGGNTGDVYKVVGAPSPEASSATDLNAGMAYAQGNLDITGLAAKGNAVGATLLAGAASSTRVCLSDDSGKNWRKTRKEPSGGSKTYLLHSPDKSRIYAATSGTESGFSVSKDGTIWNQTGLIDTSITSILEAAPSPRYAQDSTLFLLTFGGKHSLWRTLNGGLSWERIFSSNLTGVDSLSLIRISPQYGMTGKVVFLAGVSATSPAIWKSNDNGQSFNSNLAIDPVSRAAIPVDVWVLVNDSEFFIGSYDGSKGLVYHTVNSGFTYEPGATAGSLVLRSIALSPNYAAGGTILAGNSGGWVYSSNDRGNSFKPLPADAATAPLIGDTYVAFDAGFAQSRIIYASSNTADKGVYRFTIGTSSMWERIDGTLPAGARLKQLTVSSDGLLYVANGKAGGGMERCLDPTFPLNPGFETVTRGLAATATLSGMWQSGDRLWSIDTAVPQLLTFRESMATQVTLVSPADGAPGVGTVNNHNITNVSLDWVANGATTYQWQLDYDTDFSSVPAGFEDTTQASTVRLPALEPATTYYWRVRATAPDLNPWSARRSFTTSLSDETVALRAESPAAGAKDVPVSPLFQWSAVSGADSYELLAATDSAFNNPEVTRVGDYALSATAWQCNVNLKFGTTYYWKVRARTASSRSDWSSVSTFTTGLETTPQETTLTPTPAIPQLPVTPNPTLPSPVYLPHQPQVAPSNPALTPEPLLLPPSLPPAAPGPELPGWMMYLMGGLILAVIVLTVAVTVIVLAVIRRE
ncbi:MAG: hypothetical protein PHR56_04975 [Dehalococcoidales bacterium]|nr:hypothetical protein [Dehalococcoidales bacterium]